MREALFTPELPNFRTSIVPVCALLGLAMVSRCSTRPALAFAWQDATVGRRVDAAAALGAPVLNALARDIRKSTVEAAQRRALGYPLAVDPRTHHGPLVRKSEENAAHDGAIVTGPVAEPLAGHVYQRLVLSERDGGRVEQLRVAVAGGRLAVAYVKHRPTAARFSNGCDDVRLAEPDALFSAEERAGLLRLAAVLGLDFGDFDVLRDDADGRIHVVDVATTPFGPPLALGARGRGVAVGRLAEAVEAHIV